LGVLLSGSLRLSGANGSFRHCHSCPMNFLLRFDAAAGTVWRKTVPA
jgi:hypothetical protein